MHDKQSRPVRTGGDPRALSDFMALRDEMSKLTHPACPDVNWKQVEALSLSLFEINGVELQTCVWYTLARSHLARVSGLNEGLTILTALLRHQWTQLWPKPANVRAEILSGMLQRLQKCFRTILLTPSDVPALALAEQLLQELKDILRHHALNNACQMNPLLQLIRGALSRLENSPPQEEATEDVPDPAFTMTEEVTTPTSRLVYVIRKEPDVEMQVAEDVPAPPKRWPVFMAGMATTLVLSAATLFGWQAIHHPDEAIQAMAASVAWIPEPMTPKQIEAFRGTENYRTHSGMWLSRMTNQVNWLTTLVPGWRLRYGQGLIIQAKALWPNDPMTRAMIRRWEQYQVNRTLSVSDLNGWHNGMMQLHALSAQLDALDRQKSKCLTGIELKTIVWRITSTFASSVPVEEQLRQLVSAPGEVDSSIAQTAQRLDSLIHTLEQLSVEKTTLTTSLQ